MNISGCALKHLKSAVDSSKQRPSGYKKGWKKRNNLLAETFGSYFLTSTYFKRFHNFFSSDLDTWIDSEHAQMHIRIEGYESDPIAVKNSLLLTGERNKTDRL